MVRFQILELLLTDHLPFLKLGRHLVHLDLSLEAELPLEIFEVAEEHELPLVVEAAEHLGLFLSVQFFGHRINLVPDDPGGEHDLVVDLNRGVLLQSRFGPVGVKLLVREGFLFKRQDMGNAILSVNRPISQSMSLESRCRRIHYSLLDVVVVIDAAWMSNTPEVPTSELEFHHQGECTTSFDMTGKVQSGLPR